MLVFRKGVSSWNEESPTESSVNPGGWALVEMIGVHTSSCTVMSIRRWVYTNLTCIAMQ